MKIAITGATGFLGSHIAEQLHNAGSDVRALVRRTSDTSFLKELGVRRVLGAVDDPLSLEPLVNDVDIVIHCAGLTKARDEEEFRRINAGGVAAMLDATQRLAPDVKRFVHVSSLAVSGPSSDDGTPRSEDEPPEPLSRYGRSKLLGEQAALERAAEVPVTIVRPGAVYGPRDKEIFAFFQMASRVRMAPVIGHGRNLISMIYAPDCAGAIIAAADDHSERTGVVYHVDDGGAWSWNELAGALGAAFGKRVYRPRLPVSIFSVAASISEAFGKLTGKAMIFNRDKVAEFTMSCVGGHARITDDLGWTPEVPMPEGMKRSVRWYQENGWL